MTTIDRHPNTDSLDSTPDLSTRRAQHPNAFSYAYGAPSPTPKQISTASLRLPSPGRSVASRRSVQDQDRDNDETASSYSYIDPNQRSSESGAVRYARLKQRNQNAPAHTGPGTIVSPPKPTAANLRDTSVNVATAFTIAAQDYTMSNVNGSYTTTSGRLAPETYNPNHTTTSAPGRRALPGPPPSRARKPASKRGREDAEEDVDEDGRPRAKSPFPEVANAFVRAISPGVQAITTYVLRQNTAGEEESQGGFQSFALPSSKPQSRIQQIGSALSQTNRSDEYNYSREESLANRIDLSAEAAKGTIRRRPRASVNVDNKAYKPTQDDMYSDDDAYSSEGRGKRRKAKPIQKKAHNLPSLGPGAPKRRTRKKKGPSGEEIEESDGESPVRSIRSSVPPPIKAGSVVDWNEQPQQDSYTGELDLEQNLEPEAPYADEFAISKDQAQPGSSRFSIGGLLGRVVNLSFRSAASLIQIVVGFVSMVVILALRIIASIFDIALARPWGWISNAMQRADWNVITKYIVGLLAIYLFATGLRQPGPSPANESVRSWIPTWNSAHPDYIPPSVPANTLNEINKRLQEVENRLSDVAFAQKRVTDKLESHVRVSSEAATKVDFVDSALQHETKARVEAEQKLNNAAATAVQSLRGTIFSSAAEADAKIRALEDRLVQSEIGIRDALESFKTLPKSSQAPAPAPAPSASGHGWWNKVAGNDGKAITLKSSDGQDITSLIGSLVDNAFLRYSKDTVAKPDYALYYAGGRIIPAFTTPTYQIEPQGVLSYTWGMITGRGFVEGKPPVTATHPDINVGNCWPFKGSRGQLGVMLARSVIVTDFTIDHAAKEVAYDVRSAPKKMEVWGLVEGTDNVRKVREYHARRERRYQDSVAAAINEGRAPPSKEDPYPASLPESEDYIRLAQFTYDVNKNNHVQTFSVPQEIQDLGVDIGIVVLLVESNWGEPEWTCLYRFRVHGHEVERRPYPLSETDE